MEKPSSFECFDAEQYDYIIFVATTSHRFIRRLGHTQLGAVGVEVNCMVKEP